MTSKTSILAFLLLFCLLDLTYSAYQHYHSKLDGDIASIVVPKTSYQYVLEAPLGIEAIKTGKHYPGTNRFFCHYLMKVYFSEMPLFIGQFTDKISALYWSSAIFKTLVQLLLLLMMGLYAHSLAPLRVGSYIFLLFLITPFFQVKGYAHVLGIINPSITYVFFYSWPVAMLLVFYYPFFRSFLRQEPPQISLVSKAGLLLLVIFLPLSSPVNSPVILLVTLFYLYSLVTRFWQDRKANKTGISQWFFKHMNLTTFIFFSLISIAALYAMYLGQFNSENPSNAISLIDRYPRLLQGIGNMLTIKIGYPVFLGALGVSWYLFTSRNKESDQRIRQLFWWALIFFISYIALLPLGGYRSYRPYIVRTDTMLPVLCGLIILYSTLAFYLQNSLTAFSKRTHTTLLLVVITIFTLADGTNFDQNTAERQGLQTLMQSRADTIVFPEGQLVLSWDKLDSPEASKWNAILLQRWGITDTIRLYYNDGD